MTGGEDVNAEEAVRFCEAVRRLVDLLFDEEMEYFDSLPPRIERELGVPLAGLSDALHENRPLCELRSAAKLVEDIAEEQRAFMPKELGRLIDDVREVRLPLESSQ